MVQISLAVSVQTISLAVSVQTISLVVPVFTNEEEEEKA